MTVKEARKELLRRGAEIKPTVHVGKEGLTDSLVDELVKQVKSNKLVKVKVLPAAEEEVSALGEELSSRSGTVLVDSRGSVLIFSDKRTHQQLTDRKPRC